MQPFIELKGLTKDYGNHRVLDGLNLSVARNEFVTLLGPSGCGKTTTLRLIGGFEQPTAGEVCVDGKSINHLQPYERRLNTVFQRYALFPHMNIFENVAFGLRIQKKDNREIAHKVGDALQLVNLAGFEKRSVDSLSGGQQQRVAIARAIVNEPELLLLDEPLGALDLKLRKEMQDELKRMQQRLGITFIYVTHDQEEALTMSDRIVVMKDGYIQQTGTPEQIYNEPVNAFVADFIGESNILPGTMVADQRVVISGHEFPCVDTGFAASEAVDVVIRPEDVVLTDAHKGTVSGVVSMVTFKGVHYEMHIECEGFRWLCHSTRLAAAGSEVGLRVHPEDIQIMRKVKEA